MDNKYEVSVKYAIQIVSVRMTDEQKEEYDEASHSSLVLVSDMLFNNYSPLPRHICDKLARNGMWISYEVKNGVRELGNWLTVTLPMSYQGNFVTDNLTVRSLYNFSYHASLYDDFWCSYRTLHVEAMRDASGLPRALCDVVYDVHDEGDVMTEIVNGDNVSINSKTNLVTIWR